MLMTMEDGGLRAAIVDGATIRSAWSMEANPNGDMGWTQIESLSLGSCSLLVLCPPVQSLLAVPMALEHFFFEADGRLFSIVLKSGQVKILCEGNYFQNVIPYSSWYTLGTVFAWFMIFQCLGHVNFC